MFGHDISVVFAECQRRQRLRAPESPKDRKERQCFSYAGSGNTRQRQRLTAGEERRPDRRRELQHRKQKDQSLAGWRRQERKERQCLKYSVSRG